jgi:(4-(4-[2-(gamma-L-glutamylamino)ethyl]phenoxymethyl)furan-2-yl)methanamine synthase
MSKATIGWDIGGAHLKAVLLNAKGSVQKVAQLPCPLWRGLHELESAIQSTIKQFNINGLATTHAVTMTGELADCFADRYEGVCAIAELTSNLLGKHVYYYAADSGFVAFEDVKRFASDIASANWHASASALAMQVGDALLIDIGSTTTDIIPIIDGKVSIKALSDAARLQNDTLVYTGVVRTPVMALAQKLPFEDVEVNVMAEHFATMADVYRLTGELNVASDLAETADGKGKTQLESARRLARVVGRDVDKSLTEWIKLAYACRILQVYQIKSAVLKHLKPNRLIIGAGAGSFLAQQIAADLNCEYISACEAIFMRASRTNNQLQLVYSAGMTLAVTAHIDLSLQHEINTCFPAYAVALLALNHQHA